MLFSCCSQRLDKTEMQHTEWLSSLSSPLRVITSLCPCSLICPSGSMKLILCFRNEPVCWSWFTVLCVSVAEIPSPSFLLLFICLQNTGPVFFVTIFRTTTVTAYACSWPVSVCTRVRTKTSQLKLIQSTCCCTLLYRRGKGTLLAKYFHTTQKLRQAVCVLM